MPGSNQVNQLWQVRCSKGMTSRANDVMTATNGMHSNGKCANGEVLLYIVTGSHIFSKRKIIMSPGRRQRGSEGEPPGL